MPQIARFLSEAAGCWCVPSTGCTHSIGMWSRTGKCRGWQPCGGRPGRGDCSRLKVRVYILCVTIDGVVHSASGIE